MACPSSLQELWAVMAMQSNGRRLNSNDWIVLSEAELIRFGPQITAAIKWVLSCLEQAERRQKHIRSRFDQPVQDTLRRAS